MPVSGIKSKPVYAPLRADLRGRYHLMLAVEPGSGALSRVLRELQTACPAALPRTRVLLVATAPILDELRPFALAGVNTFVDSAALLDDFRSWLERSLMGTRVYIAGPENFIGRALKLALEFDLNQDEIRAEELGTLARRVYCVHCRSTADEVRTNIVRCTGCERWLLVRDHYSRRLAAYMGVMVDAEVPGELPAVRELYP